MVSGSDSLKQVVHYSTRNIYIENISREDIYKSIKWMKQCPLSKAWETSFNESYTEKETKAIDNK